MKKQILLFLCLFSASARAGWTALCAAGGATACCYVYMEYCRYAKGEEFKKHLETHQVKNSYHSGCKFCQAASDSLDPGYYGVFKFHESGKMDAIRTLDPRELKGLHFNGWLKLHRTHYGGVMLLEDQKLFDGHYKPCSS